MHYVGIDLHKLDLVVAVEDSQAPVGRPTRIPCQEEGRIAEFFENIRPFRAVIEASTSYRWLYDLLSPMGEVVLAHPLKLRAIVSARAKTDKLDSALLARLLRGGLIPRAYVAPERYQVLRDLTRARARLSYQATSAKNQVHAQLGRANLHAPFANVFCKRGKAWLEGLDLGHAGELVRDELLRRLEHYHRELEELDKELEKLAETFPEVRALADLYGLGLYSQLLIVAEIADPERFSDARQVGAYAGLTARVHQSGGHCYRGHISKQGSRWLRWILVQAAMKLVRRDAKLRNFYTRIRKRSGSKVARVAAARKLAEICWVRLRRWHRDHAS
jgi:transposase